MSVHRVGKAARVIQALFVGCLLATGAAQAASIDLGLTQCLANPNPGIRGGNVTFTLSYSVSATATGASITFPLPANTTFASSTRSECILSGTEVACLFPSLPTGSGSLGITLGTNSATANTLTTQTSISVGATDTDPTSGNDRQNCAVSVNDGADLQLALGGPAEAPAGSDIVWTATVTNNGPNSAANSVFKTTLPATLTYLSATGSGWNCVSTAPNLSCTRNSPLANGVTAPVLSFTTQLAASVTSGGFAINGGVTSSTGDWDDSNNADDHTVTIVAGADLQVSQALPAPTMPLPNNPVNFVLTAKNNGPSDATDGVNVTFELPAGFAAGPAPTPTGAGWGICSWAGQVLTCPHAGNYISGRSETITVPATTPNITAPQTYSNIPAVIVGGATGPVDPRPNNNQANSSVQVSPDQYAGLAFTKSKSPNPVAVGGDIISLIRVSNPTGPYPAAIGSITVTDILTDADETYNGFTAVADWNCTSQPAVPAAGQTSIICTNLKVIVPGSALNLSIRTQAARAGTLRNDAELVYSGPGPGIAPIFAVITATAATDSPDLSIVKTVATNSNTTSEPGSRLTLLNTEDTLTYTLVITNALATNVAARDLVISDQIPGFMAGTIITAPVITLGNVSGSSTATFTCAVSGANVTCTQTAGALNAGDTVTVSIPVKRPLQSGNLTNTASVFSTSQGDPDRTNNTDSVNLRVQPIADLEMVSKAAAPSPVPAGADVEYILTFRNLGPDAASDVVVKDSFVVSAGEPGFTFLSATSSAGGSCSGLNANQSYGVGTHTIACAGLTLASGTQRTVTVRVRPNWVLGGGATTLKNNAWLYSTSASEGTAATDAPGDLVYGVSRGVGENFKSLDVLVDSADLDALIETTDSPSVFAGPDPLTFSTNNAGDDPANDIIYRVRMVNQGPSLATGLRFTYVMTPPDGKTVRFLGDDGLSTGGFSTGICDSAGLDVTGPASMTVSCTYPTDGSDQLLATLGVERLRFLKFRALSSPDGGSYVVQTRAEIFTNESDAQQGNNVSTESTTISASGFGIYGRVFLDQNNNGIPEAGDTGLGGQTIELYSGATLVATTSTNPDGSYSFTGLNAGNYRVVQPNQPANTVNGMTTPGQVGGVSTGTATSPSTPISQIDGIVLSAGDPNTQLSINNWFAEVTRPSLSGTVWIDTNHDRKLDAGETTLPGWTVELLRSGTVVQTTVSDNNGAYAFSDLDPGNDYEVRFRHPDTGVLFGRPVTNEQGTAANLGGADTSNGTLMGINIIGGQSLIEQSLPLDPGGVIYDAISRQPVRGAVVTISGPGLTGADVLGGSLEMTTGTDGFYQFLLLSTAPAGSYKLTVTAPAGYLQNPSALIPACNTVLPVSSNGDPALVQDGNLAPQESVTPHDANACSIGSSVGVPTTQYYFEFNYSPGANKDSVINNHIPLDPILGGAIVMTKTTPKVNVTRGELVPYTLTARNTLSSVLTNIAIEDQLPPGFKYIKGSAQIDGVLVEPLLEGRRLRFPERTLNGGQTLIIKMLLVVGSGVGFNEYVNQTWALNMLANARVSNVASASVRVVADPTFDCSDLIGTVYDDKNRNGYQDEGEPGIAGARVATPKGWLVTSDQYGRFHIACADVPSEMRGSNFILKADERSLPSGYRITTENPRVVRMTQGRLVKANFGASIHRVVRLDLNSAAFTADNTLTELYQARLPEVLTLLYAEPSILRIAYRMPVEGEVKDARKRVSHVRDWFKSQWEPEECCYDLQVEEEIVPVSDSVEVIR